MGRDVYSCYRVNYKDHTLNNRMRAIKLIGYMLKICDLPLNESIKNEIHVMLRILGQMYESTSV